MIFELIAIFILLFVIIGLVYQFMPEIYLWVLLGSMVFYGIYLSITLYFHARKQQAPVQEQPIMSKPSMVEPMREKKPVVAESKMPEMKMEAKQADPEVEKLKEFVQKNLKVGFKPKTVRDALVKQGWSKEKVDLAFK